MKAMLAAAVLLCGTAVRRVRGGIHLGSGLGRIGMVDVRHGSLVAKCILVFPSPAAMERLPENANEGLGGAKADVLASQKLSLGLAKISLSGSLIRFRGFRRIRIRLKQSAHQ